MVNDDYKYSDLTSQIIKCAYAVHNKLGCGFQEVIYQRCLAIEMEENRISFVRELEMPLYYRDRDVGSRRVDFLLAQAINYLEAYKLEVGLLINFGAEKLEFKRVMKKNHELKKGNQIGYSDYRQP